MCFETNFEKKIHGVFLKKNPRHIPSAKDRKDRNSFYAQVLGRLLHFFECKQAINILLTFVTEGPVFLATLITLAVACLSNVRDSRGNLVHI